MLTACIATRSRVKEQVMLKAKKLTKWLMLAASISHFVALTIPCKEVDRGEMSQNINGSEAPRLVAQLGYSQTVNSAIFSRDEKYVLTAGDKTAKLWEISSGREIRGFEGHSDWVNTATFSPDDKYVLTASDDGTARLWEIDSGREVRKFEGHSEGINSAIYSADGKHVMTVGSFDNTARLWETSSGKEVRRFEAPSAKISSAIFSPDGRHVLTASGGPSLSGDNTARLWEINSGGLVRKFEGHIDRVLSAIFSPDGKYVLTASNDETARLWETSNGREVRKLEGHSGWVKSAIFSPDGTYILTASEDNTARVWEVESGREIRKFQERRFSSPLAIFSPDGKYVATPSAFRTASLWDVNSGQEIRSFEELSFPFSVNSITFTRDGKYLLTASGSVAEYRGNTARLFSIESGREVRRFDGNASYISSARLSPDGKYVLTASEDNTARLWDINSGREVRRFVGHSNVINSAIFSPNGKYVLTAGGGRNGEADNTVRLWEVETGREVRKFKGHKDRVLSAIFSPDGKHILTTSEYSAHGWLWQVESGELLQSFEDTGESTSAGFSADGKYVLTSGYGGNASIWEVETGLKFRKFTGHSEAVISAVFSEDEKYVLTASYDNTARLWEVKSGNEVRRFEGHSEQLTSAIFSPDGKYVMTASFDETARLWETSNGREVRKFEGHSGWVNSATFSPDGKYALTVGQDSTVRLWDVNSGREVHKFVGHSNEISSAIFSPDGKTVLTACWDGTTRFWSVSTGKELCSLVSFIDGSWAVVSSDGRFDTNTLEEIRGLHWIMADDPMNPLPLEIFMRNYYEPGLLARLLKGEQFGSRPISQLNRAQPPVNIIGIERQKDSPDLVTVTVEVAKATSQRQRDEKGNLRETGVYDLRLFRDGQIVGQYADGKPQALPQAASDKEKLLAWRDENEIKLDANGKRTIKFANVKLPQSAGKHDVQFTAYAFNEDRVKSETAKTDKPFAYDVAKERARKGRAYLITVGVNAFENPAFDLKCSVNDANAIQKTMFDKLSKAGAYSDIAQVSLISDAKKIGAGREFIENTATKSNVRAVLEVLSGKRKPSELPDSMPNAAKLRNQLQQTNPEDLVLISFSSHSYADSNGDFYFVLSDTGPSRGEKITEALLQKLSPNFLSSEELSLWLRDVDAGEMLMIVDACHSAAAVAGGEFKPGPMGSRGLGQLSYDKGMRILTATQAADVAYGIGALKQGLLTYVLVKDGIEGEKADFKPANRLITIAEWLEYGEQGVPKLLEDAELKARQTDAPVELKDLVQKTLSDVKTQRPSLFDFSRKRAEVLLVKQ